MKRRINREDIIKTGLNLMFLNGYNATGIKEITSSIDIPKGSFYNHFESKEAFGLEVLQYYCDNGVAMHKTMLLDSKLPPLKRLKTFYAGMIKNYGKELEYKMGCIMGNFSTELADVNESFRKILDKEFDKCEKTIATCLKEAQAAGEIDEDLNPKAISAFILNSWHGALIRMKSTANSKPLKDFMSLVFDHLLVRKN